jgi:hypothetical protein
MTSFDDQSCKRKDRDLYRPLDRQRDWQFFDEKTPIPESVLATITPLTEEHARSLWRRYISATANHTMLMKISEWPQQVFKSSTRLSWHADWNDSRPQRVAAFLRDHLRWPSDATALFFRNSETAVQAPWWVFLDQWIHFLFDDEGPILLSLEHPQAVLFGPNGVVYVRERPQNPGGI